MVRSTNQNVVQQSSEISMLNAELQALRKEREQLLGTHSKYKSQEHRISTAIQTDQVNIMIAVIIS